jgi:UDP-glucose 4-epimerase
MISKVFMTGATGLVGSSIVKKLVSENFDVTAISRHPGISSPNLKWFKADASNGIDSIKEQLYGRDILIHNAASLKAGIDQTELTEIQSVNVDFTEQLVSVAASSGIKKIIFTSSFSLIRKPLPEYINEESEVNPISPYSQSKYLGENAIMKISKLHNIEYAILRISSPISLNLDLMPQNVVKSWITQARDGKDIMVYGNGNRTQDFVSVEDISEAFLKSCRIKGFSGVFNIASGNTLSMKQLAELICTRYGRSYSNFGTDVNEEERWNIAIDKARTMIGYSPAYTSETCINALLQS